MIWFGLVYKACHSERTLHLVPSALWQVSSTCIFSLFVSMTHLVPSALWQPSGSVGVVPLASLHLRTSTGYEPCALGHSPSTPTHLSSIPRPPLLVVVSRVATSSGDVSPRHPQRFASIGPGVPPLHLVLRSGPSPRLFTALSWSSKSLLLLSRL